jgi:hypothetical protein
MSGQLGKICIRRNYPLFPRIGAERGHNLSSVTKSPILRLQAQEIEQRKERFLCEIGGAARKWTIPPFCPANHAIAFWCRTRTESSSKLCSGGMEHEFNRSGLVRGGIWDERIAGTNGIAMALQTGRVLTVRGGEHFFSCFHNFSCSSAPLADAENNLIGTITLVGSTPALARRTHALRTIGPARFASGSEPPVSRFPLGQTDRAAVVA